MLETTILINRSSSEPIYLQVSRQIKEMIQSGMVQPGYVLPPERRLCDLLGVNRSTVVNAYRELKDEAYIDSHVGRGTVVLPQPAGEFHERREFIWQQLFSERLVGNQDPTIKNILAIAKQPEIISFAAGLPCPQLMPVEHYLRFNDELLREERFSLFEYAPTEGLLSLREALSEWLQPQGIHADPSSTIILSGSQQGLDLVSRIFIDPGDTVIVESPTYLGAINVFRNARARILSVPVDSHGIRTDILEETLRRHRPKLIYTLPTYQNPSGVVMSLDRRKRLLELATHFHVPILEDDPYGLLSYEGASLPSLKALDRNECVLYLSTFSKILFPGVRIGYMVAPWQVTRQLALSKQTVDLHSNSPAQFVIERFIRRGLLDQHLVNLRTAYKRRRDTMEKALIRHSADYLRWKLPSGGFFFWCNFSRSIDPSILISRAAEAGVAFLPGQTCYAGDAPSNYMRLNFTYVEENKIDEGIRRLTDVIARLSPPVAVEAHVPAEMQPFI